MSYEHMRGAGTARSTPEEGANDWTPLRSLAGESCTVYGQRCTVSVRLQRYAVAGTGRSGVAPPDDYDRPMKSRMSATHLSVSAPACCMKPWRAPGKYTRSIRPPALP